MGSLSPPDGVTVLSGTWGTDMDRNESVVLSGNASLEFKSGTPADDPKISIDRIPVHKGTSAQAIYDVAVIMRATSVSSGTYTMTVEAELYNAAGTLQSTTTIHSGILTLADTWETKSAPVTVDGASDNYLVITCKKNNVAFTGYVDSIDVRRRPPSFEARQTSQTITTSTGTTMLWDESIIQTDFNYDAATGRATKIYSGVCVLTAQLYLGSSMPDGTDFFIRILDSTSGIVGETLLTNGASATPYIIAACVDINDSASYYYAQVWHSAGSNRNVGGIFRGVIIR